VFQKVRSLCHPDLNGTVVKGNFDPAMKVDCTFDQCDVSRCIN